MKKQLVTIFLSCLFFMSQSELLLNEAPLKFQLLGPIDYIPTSGVIPIPGYVLKIGYARHQWIGVKFMALTSTSNYDILIFKRSVSSNSGVYQCSVSDYYVTQGRPENLMIDTINNMDKQVTSTSDSNYFELQLFRTQGITAGEDWQRGDFVKICFFTSDSTFDKDTWKMQYENCYGFSVNNYKSQWLGYQIMQKATFDGVESKIYGGYSGPQLSLQLYIFCPQTTLSNTEVIVRIGDKISKQLGYDYHKCLLKKGDFYGNSISSLSSDLLYSGYNDNRCSITNTSSYILFYFSRLLNTYDQFDNVITKNTDFCFIVGSNQNCYTIDVKPLFPQMNIQSAIKIYQQKLSSFIALFLIYIFLFF